MAFKKGKSGNPKGRPKGTTTRPNIFDYWTDKDIVEFFEYLKDNYKEDMKLMAWVGDHLLGKAPQSIDHTTKGEKLPTPLLAHADVPNNDSTKED